LRPFKPLKLRVKPTGLAGINRILKPLAVKVRRVVALKFRQALGVQALPKRLVYAANLLASRVEGATVNACRAFVILLFKRRKRRFLTVAARLRRVCNVARCALGAARANKV
jgi:hypothetical protein